MVTYLSLYYIRYKRLIKYTVTLYFLHKQYVHSYNKSNHYHYLFMQVKLLLLNQTFRRRLHLSVQMVQINHQTKAYKRPYGTITFWWSYSGLKGGLTQVNDPLSKRITRFVEYGEIRSPIVHTNINKSRVYNYFKIHTWKTKYVQWVKHILYYKKL